LSGFFLLFSSFFFFSSPNLSDRRVNVYHTSTHGVALLRILNAGLKRAARGSLEIQDAKMTQKSPSRQHRTNLLGNSLSTFCRLLKRFYSGNHNPDIVC